MNTWRFLPWVAALLLVVACGRTEGVPSLRAAAAILREARDIPSPDRVDVLEAVEIGGIQQWISIRGRDRRNPVLLFLHGGPGFPMMPVSYVFQPWWEEYLTVVQWDQRGSGRTYAANDPVKVAPTLTVDRMIADAEELVAHLRRRFGRDKIVLMGHSWGSILGVELARRHPDWFHVYVGVGQVVSIPESERLAYEALLAEAKRTGNQEAIRDLERIAPYPDPAGRTTSANLQVERKWLRAFGGYVWGRVDDHYGDLVSLSPDYDAQAVEAWGPAISYSFDKLWPQIATLSLREVTELRCPVVLFHGRHDLTTSAQLAEEWFAKLRAPRKKMVWFERSAHMVFTEEPGKTFVHLVKDVRPIADEGVPANHRERPEPREGDGGIL
jgi:proline iminopeptidase